MEQKRPAPRPAGRPTTAGRPLSAAEKQKRRRRRRLRLVRNWVIFLSACAAAVALMTAGILWALPRVHTLLRGQEAFSARAYDGTGYTFDAADERLVLINANLPLETEPDPLLTVADDATGQRLEAEAAAAYRSMAAAALADHVSLTLAAGYQDAAERAENFAARKQLYLDEGCSEAQAEARAATVVPVADASEYATGYAADILSEDEGMDTGFADSRAYEWLCAYAAEYGFILRWPEDRQAATGMVFEPWHWRYVGVDNALAIRNSGLSLEEFLAVQMAADQ